MPTLGEAECGSGGVAGTQGASLRPWGGVSDNLWAFLEEGAEGLPLMRGLWCH